MTTTDSRPAIPVAPPSTLSGHERSDTQTPAAAGGYSSPQANSSAISGSASPAGTKDSRPANPLTSPTQASSAGLGSLSGQQLRDLQVDIAAEGQDSPQATTAATPIEVPPAGSNGTRPARDDTNTILSSPTGSGSLSGQGAYGLQWATAAEGQDSSQANVGSAPIRAAPAGTNGSRPATGDAASNPRPPVGSDSLSSQQWRAAQAETAAEGQDSPLAKEPPLSSVRSPAGSNASHGQTENSIQAAFAVAARVPGGHIASDLHYATAAGESDPGRPEAIVAAITNHAPLLADPLLALAADVLDDLEKVRIANENRLRQLTRSTGDSDGETRGFGLDESHPDVARLSALVALLAEAEHKAELNLARLMRKHPLGPWVTSKAGVGEKQAARLVAAIGDPYIRPEIVRVDETVEPSRPRLVSELWAYAGYHVVKTPVSGHGAFDSRVANAADGEQRHSGQTKIGAHLATAGVAPNRQRGHKANWSATAKMRAYLVAVSCMKCLDSPYRATYDDARAKYADAIHLVPCVRCGPKNKPAESGSPLSDGHKHARALRAVAKEVLRDLWREARRIHEHPGSHVPPDTQATRGAGITSQRSETAAPKGAQP